MTAWLIFIPIGVAAFLYGGALWSHWMPCLAAIGAIAAVQWWRGDSGASTPRLSRFTAAPLASLLTIAVFELFPLPTGWVRFFSPTRAEIQDALVPYLGPQPFTALALNLPDAFRWTLTLAGCLLLFLTAREAAWRWREHPWRTVTPLIVLGALEAALGLAQHYFAGVRSVHGTYVNRNHFAGLLEMAMPFALLAGVSLMRTRPPSLRTPAKSALLASLCLATAGLMLTAIILSLSRGGFTFALASLFVMGLAALSAMPGASRWRRWTAPAVVALLIIGAFVYFPTDDLIGRFADLATTEEITADTRVQIWRESTRVIAAYPLFGVGLGGFQSAFYRYKEVAPMNTVDYVHNDYLQLLAELGVIAFAVLIVLAGRMFRNAVRAAASPPGARRRYLGIACLGAFTALALHSLVDFNLYLPANAAVLAWIAGLSEGLDYRPLLRPLPTTTAPMVIDAVPCPPEAA